VPLISVHSPKGGVGTTSVAARLALCFAERGMPVSVVDLTEQDGLKLHFGYAPNRELPVSVAGSVDAPIVSGVRLVRMNRTGSEPATLAKALTEHASGHMVILDIESADQRLAVAASKVADLHLCIMEPTAPALASLVHLGGAAGIAEQPNFAIALNKVDEQYKLSRHCKKFLSDLYEDQFLGTVRRDEASNEALALFEPLEKSAPNSVVLNDIVSLANTIEARLGALSRSRHGRPGSVREAG
jgi:chromosome partitioning protein